MENWEQDPPPSAIEPFAAELAVRILHHGRRRVVWPERESGPAPSWTLHYAHGPGAGFRHRSLGLFPLAPDRLVLVAPFTSFRREQDRSVEISYVNLLIGPPYQSLRDRILSSPATAQTEAWVESWREDIRARRPFGPRARAALHACLAPLLADVPAGDWARCPDDGRILRALAIIDAEPAGDLSNARLAREVGLSTNAFTTLFTRQAGHPPQAQVVQRRLALAAHLLTNSGRSIPEIATACGFCDRSHLGRACTKHLGMGPASYRRQQRR